MEISREELFRRVWETPMVKLAPKQYTTRTVEVPKKKNDYWQRPKVVHDFTGKFTLEIQGYSEGRKKWADGKRQKLTEVLTDFMEGLVADAAHSPEHALKPAFDLLWQAAGFERSRNFDAAGSWAPPA